MKLSIAICLLLSSSAAAAPSGPSAEDPCQMCQGTLHKLKEYRDKVHDKVEHALQAICDSLSPPLSESCKMIVDRVQEALDQALNNPQLTCQKAHLCQQNSKVMRNGNTLNNNEQQPDVCELCQDAVETATEYLLSAEGVVENVLYQVCSYLGPFRDECAQGVFALSNMVLQLLSTLNPQLTCEDIQLCPDDVRGGHHNNNYTVEHTENLRNFVQARRNTNMNMNIFGNNNNNYYYLCTACKMASTAFTMECRQPVFQQSVVNLLKPICQLKPGTEEEKEKCKGYIAQNVPNMLNQFICAAVAPQFCKAVHWC